MSRPSWQLFGCCLLISLKLLLLPFVPSSLFFWRQMLWGTEKDLQNDKSSWKKIKKNHSPLWSYPCTALGPFGRYTESEETMTTAFIWLLFNSTNSIKKEKVTKMYLVLHSGRLTMPSSIEIESNYQIWNWTILSFVIIKFPCRESASRV